MLPRSAGSCPGPLVLHGREAAFYHDGKPMMDMTWNNARVLSDPQSVVLRRLA